MKSYPSISTSIDFSKTYEKYQKLMKRLQSKIEMSATPITGFMVGLSGTDSILTYILLSEVAATMGNGTPAFFVHGIHYMEPDTIEDTFTRARMGEWLTSQYGGEVHTLHIHNGEHDQYRWADLHYRAVNRVPVNGYASDPSDNRYWVAGTVNATEKALGTYSIMSKSASIEPIASVYKSEVLQLCRHFDVPDEIIKSSQIPDCICGREEFAAEHIDLIDDVLRNNLSQDYSTDLIQRAMKYINTTKQDNGFKNRTPYTV